MFFSSHYIIVVLLAATCGARLDIYSLTPTRVGAVPGPVSQERGGSEASKAAQCSL